MNESFVSWLDRTTASHLWNRKNIEAIRNQKRRRREREKERENNVEIQFERRNSKIVVRPTAATLRRTSKWNYATLETGTLGRAQRLVCRRHSTTIWLKGPKPLIVLRLTSIKRYLMNKSFASCTRTTTIDLSQRRRLFSSLLSEVTERKKDRASERASEREKERKKESERER